MDNLELMEKWHSMAVLHNIDVDDLEGGWNNNSDEDILQLLDDIQTMNRRLADPTKEMRFALLTSEMGVTTSDIADYEDYRYRVAAEEEAEQRRMAEEANVHLRHLIDVRGFRIVNGKQFPKHMHFEFTTSDGIDVKGRLFKFNWSGHRIWLSWKNAKGKTVRQMWDSRISEIRFPKGFPTDWDTSYTYSKVYEQVAYIVAHMVITKTLPKDAKHLMPKR